MLARAARVVFAALVLTLPLAPVVRADQDIVSGKYVNKPTLAIDTTFFHTGTMENVHITGSLLVKTVVKYTPNAPVKVLNSYKLGRDVVAVGMTSGDPYTVKGKNTIKHTWVPNTPIKGVDHNGVLNVLPNDPFLPNNPWRLHYHLDYDANGVVSGSPTLDYPGNPAINTCTAIATVCN